MDQGQKKEQRDKNRYNQLVEPNILENLHLWLGVEAQTTKKEGEEIVNSGQDYRDKGKKYKTANSAYCSKY